MMFGNAGYAGQPMSPGFAPGIPGVGGTAGYGNYGGYLDLPGSNSSSGYQPQFQGVVPTQSFVPKSLAPKAATPGLGKAGLLAKKAGAFGKDAPLGGFAGFKESMGGWGGMAKFGVDTVVGLGELYAASKALELSRDQFDFNKQFAETNLANQTKTYNTRLEDRATARAVMEGRSDEERDAYIAKNRLGGA